MSHFFSELNKHLVGFLKTMMTTLAENSTHRELSEIFVKLHFNSEMKLFRDGFSMFMQHFVLKDKAFMAELDERIRDAMILIETAIRKKDSAFML